MQRVQNEADETSSQQNTFSHNQLTNFRFMMFIHCCSFHYQCDFHIAYTSARPLLPVLPEVMSTTILKNEVTETYMTVDKKTSQLCS